jgi:hypothetical protein
MAQFGRKPPACLGSGTLPNSANACAPSNGVEVTFQMTRDGVMTTGQRVS